MRLKITPRTGNGQTECIRCKEAGRWALNWDSFLYNIDGMPGAYCWKCVKEIKEEEDNNETRN